ncbi:type II toxin-antitoxin system HipA family toxin (plasmid) [Pseudarthrobacter sp. P1]|uniref:type II toxin-antitoxin system HipA family toxin n=1 Tax=Pseudarthrobacter sp. P1 TaxID=3418418 RepID=UPI003CECA0B2
MTAIDVVVDVRGVSQPAGTLWVHHRGGQSATFRYLATYLADRKAYALDPALPLSTGVFQTRPGQAMFNAFSDGAPDRWGQNLLRREERERARSDKTTPRTLTPADFLLSVRDDVRQGSIRYRDPADGTFLSTHPRAVPKLVDLARLLGAVDRLDAESPVDRDIRDLIDAGGSLGGARPKAAVTMPGGKLAIAKFPRKGSDEWDVIRWEKVELDLALRAGVTVASAQLIEAGGRPILLVERFDRAGDQRIGFSSALTMLEATDGERRSYLEIVEAIETRSVQAGADLEELFRRIAFSILTGNTDDHLRNHGFLRDDGRGGWALSPAYDLNASPHSPDRLSTTIEFDDDSASIDLLMSTCGYYRLKPGRAKEVIRQVEDSTREWAILARDAGLSRDEIDLMALAYDGTQRKTAAAM